ncbi:hypothetical protein [Algoriphagus taiwanensis]|uniref:WD40 repeat protein n=1 Tax=Algoriphagus taiwanensis TaxID=1445656 RepID=A0ABQ6PYK2_9BACT|nr:hypothetical protein Ataiwa_12920 [Algoriphagus taiwanensis]
MKVLLITALFCFTAFALQAQDLHQWYERNNLGVEFNPDQSKVLIVGYDRVTLWDTSTGQVMKSIPMTFDGQPIAPNDFKFIDAAPDLSEFIFQVKNSYRRFMMDIEDIELFPDFQDRQVKQILGYDTRGWMVFFSEGAYQGFFRVKQEGNVSNIQFISKEFINKASLSNDHRYIFFSRDQTFRYLDIGEMVPKPAVDTKLPGNASWKDEHLPSGMVTLYSWDNKEPAGKQVVWRYFIELGKSEGKRLKGNAAQSFFPEESYCGNFPYSTYGATKDQVWIMYYGEKDADRAQPVFQHYLAKKNRGTCEKVAQIDFSESKSTYLAKKDEKRNNYLQEEKARKEQEKALKPSWYAEYISKFVNLPSTYQLNYETISGVDVTNLDFVRSEQFRIGNPQEMAIGRVCNCSNGNKAVLRVSRYRSNGMDRQAFFIFTYDSSGNELSLQKIAETQKYNGEFPVLSFFTLKSQGDSWTADVSVRYPNGRERKELFSGNCQ